MIARSNPPGGRELVRRDKSVPNLRPAREPTSNGAADVSPGTSSKSLKDRDLLWDLTGAVVAVRCLGAVGSFRKLFLQRKAADRLAVGKVQRRVRKHLSLC